MLVSFAACVWFYVTQPLFTSPEPANQTLVSLTRLEAHVRTISEGIFPRDFEQTEGLERVASYVREQFEKAQGAVSDQPFQVNGKTYRNVIASFGPESGELIIVGAHYDSFGPNAAADDNASGVAGLIELAYLLGQQAPKYGPSWWPIPLKSRRFFAPLRWAARCMHLSLSRKARR